MKRDLYALDRWIAQHPVLAWLWSAGFVVLIVYMGILFRWMVGQ